jgi:anhydro-N-acetylmuramic acid kinase
MTLAIGLMSGTSCDGVSAALADFTDEAFQVLAYRTIPYPEGMRRALLQASSLTAPALARLNVQLGERLAAGARAVLRRGGVRAEDVAVIGSHGHTVYHGPADRPPCTLQLGAPAVIAERTGVAVAADFRPRDLAAGGDGAPLIPAFDAAYFGAGVPRAMQNLGGIANVALVGAGVAPIAFDTGPGNTLIDAAVRRLSRGRAAFDRGGRLAATGRVDPTALARLARHPYFRRRPPKSTGPETFHPGLLDEAFGRQWTRRGADVVATLTRLSAWSIADAYRRFLPIRPAEVVVNGGGAFNRALLAHLRALLAPIPVRSIADYGLHPQAKEPVAFAYLGWCALRGRLNHLPSTTGARHARVLGSLTPGHLRRGALLQSA